MLPAEADSSGPQRRSSPELRLGWLTRTRAAATTPARRSATSRTHDLAQYTDAPAPQYKGKMECMLAFGWLKGDQAQMRQILVAAAATGTGEGTTTSEVSHSPHRHTKSQFYKNER